MISLRGEGTVAELYARGEQMELLKMTCHPLAKITEHWKGDKLQGKLKVKIFTSA